MIKKTIIILLLIVTIAYGYGSYFDRGDYENKRGDILLSYDEAEMVWFNLDANLYQDATEVNSISVRASESLYETYYARWPINKGEPNSVLMTDGATNSQWFWAQIDQNELSIDFNEPNFPLIGLPELTPWNVTFVDVNGYPLYEDPNYYDFTYYEPGNAFGIGLSNLGTPGFADNWIRVYSLLHFEPNLLNVTIGRGSEDTASGPNNVTIGNGAGAVLDEGYQNTLGGNNSGKKLTNNTDDTFYGYNSGTNVNQSGSFRDEFFITGDQVYFYWFDRFGNHIRTTAIPDGGVDNISLAVSQDGTTIVAGWNNSGHTYPICEIDLDLNITFPYVPDGGWPSVWINGIEYGEDDETIYFSAYRKIWKFNTSTHAMIWYITYDYSEGELGIDKENDIIYSHGFGNLKMFDGSDGSVMDGTPGPGTQFVLFDNDNNQLLSGGTYEIAIGQNIALHDPNLGYINSYGDNGTAYNAVVYDGYYYVTKSAGSDGYKLLKFDTSLNLIAGTAAVSGQGIAVDQNGNIVVCLEAVSASHMYILDTDLNVLSDISFTGTYPFAYSELESINASDQDEASRNTGIGSYNMAGASAGSEPNEATNVGYKGMFNVESGNLSTGLGAYNLFKLTSGDRNAVLGPYAGYWLTTEDGRFIVDNRKRADAATEIISSILYGQMAEDPNDQWLNINAGVLSLPFGRFDVNDVNVLGSLTLQNLTASRLVSTDASKNLESSDANDWIRGTANQVTVTDDGDGKITLLTPQDIHTGATPTFAGMNLTGSTFTIQTSEPPDWPWSTGTMGQFQWDSNYIYVCVSTNSWKRTAISDWSSSLFLTNPDGTYLLNLDDSYMSLP